MTRTEMLIEQVDIEILRLKFVRDILMAEPEMVRAGVVKLETQFRRNPSAVLPAARPPHPKKGKKLSAKVRANMSAAQQRRHGKFVEPAEPVNAAKPAKRVISPEGRKRIAEAQRRRWAAKNPAVTQ